MGVQGIHMITNYQVVFFAFGGGRTRLTTTFYRFFVPSTPGSIPESLANLGNLQELRLNSNQLTGQFFFIFG
jgi:hypothetical protein